NGARYVKHNDTGNDHGPNRARVLTTILYLNPEWEPQHGGQLRLHLRSGARDVAPVLNRLLLFWSDKRVPHEVMPAYRHRYAISHWYYHTDKMKEAPPPPSPSPPPTPILREPPPNPDSASSDASPTHASTSQATSHETRQPLGGAGAAATHPSRSGEKAPRGAGDRTLQREAPPKVQVEYTAVQTDEYRMLSGRTLQMTLVSQRKLHANRLWPAATLLGDWLQKHPQYIAGKSVAGAFGMCGDADTGLPSVVAALLKASLVVATDFPDEDMLANVAHNLQSNVPEQSAQTRVEGYKWGDPVDNVLGHALQHGGRFDVILMADTLYELEHTRLLSACRQCLSADGMVLITFQHHNPTMRSKVMEFFDEAKKGPEPFDHEQVFVTSVPPYNYTYYEAEENEIVDWVHCYRLFSPSWRSSVLVADID
ncbi:hypothetical protein CYMTET_27206, partial [Cymbomonas tetramitiformis]